MKVQKGKIYSMAEIQTVWRQFYLDPHSIEWSDDGVTWNEVPSMDTGKWALRTRKDGKVIDWMFRIKPTWGLSKEERVAEFSRYILCEFRVVKPKEIREKLNYLELEFRVNKGVHDLYTVVEKAVYKDTQLKDLDKLSQYLSKYILRIKRW